MKNFSFHFILSFSFLFFLSLSAALSNDPSLKQPVEPTLKQKIGQMIMIGFKGTELHDNDSIVRAILDQKIGGVILFDYDMPTKTYDRNIKNPEQLKRLTQQLQNYAQASSEKNNNHQLNFLLIAVDYEGGKVNRLKESYGFPKTLSAEEIGHGKDMQTQTYAQQMAQTLRTAGINMNFAPVLDVNVNPSNPVIGALGRSFSSSSSIVSHHARFFSQAYKKAGIICAYKHFPGHGSSTNDSHLGFVDITKTWQPYELLPYSDLLNKPYSCPVVMPAHVVHRQLDTSGDPASLSYEMTTHLLREQLNFQGVVVTDDLQMKAISDNYSLPDTLRKAINAGANILVFGNQLSSTPQDPQQIIDIIYAEIQTGKIPSELIEQSYQRIIELKKAYLKTEGA